MTKQIDIYPCNIPSTEADQILAKEILKDDKNYVVRYIRHQPTVGLAKVPVRNQDGAIIPDAPWERKRVICSGIPYACIIAFVHRSELLIGWSKRIEDRKLLETPDLHALFRKILEDTKGVTETSDDYQVTFDVFCRSLMSVLSYSPKKDVELAFSKNGGKVAAIIRGLHDTISIKGNFISSAASGPVPHDIAKNLPWFIEYAENVYSGKAANVGHPEIEQKSVVASAGHALAAT